MGDLSACDAPNPFDRIQFGRVRGKEKTHKSFPMSEKEIFQSFCSMPSGVVQNEVNLPIGMLEKILQKMAKGLGVEGSGSTSKEASRFQVEGPEDTHFLARRSGTDAGLLSPGSPHANQAGMSLKMYFVLAPKLNMGILHPLVEFFLKASCWRGSAS